MRGIFKWFGQGGGATPPASAPAPGIDLERVSELVRYFPIGTRLHYYPEYQRNIKLDTVILGYQLNDHFVYSDHALRRAAGGDGFSLHTPDGQQHLPRVERFSFVVPFQSRSELDYGAAGGTGSGEGFTEKAVNDFKRGNSITLFNKGANGKVPHVDSVVARLMDMRDGYYANRRVVLLRPDPDSFQFLDQRQYHRIYTQIYAVLSEGPEATGIACVVRDFSERFLRIAREESPQGRDWVKEGARVHLSIKVQDSGEPIRLRAVIHRLEEGAAVLSLTGIFKQKRFQNLDLIDELDLKATLLHQPETQQVLHGDSAPRD